MPSVRLLSFWNSVLIILNVPVPERNLSPSISVSASRIMLPLLWILPPPLLANSVPPSWCSGKPISSLLRSPLLYHDDGSEDAHPVSILHQHGSGKRTPHSLFSALRDTRRPVSSLHHHDDSGTSDPSPNQLLKLVPSDNFNAFFFDKKVPHYKSKSYITVFVFLIHKLIFGYVWALCLKTRNPVYFLKIPVLEGIYLGRGTSRKCEISEMKINTSFYEYIEDLDDLGTPKMHDFQKITRI